MKNIELDAKNIQVAEEPAEEGLDMPTTPEGCKARMEEVNQHIKDVSYQAPLEALVCLDCP